MSKLTLPELGFIGLEVAGMPAIVDILYEFRGH